MAYIVVGVPVLVLKQWFILLLVFQCCYCNNVLHCCWCSSFAIATKVYIVVGVPVLLLQQWLILLQCVFSLRNFLIILPALQGGRFAINHIIIFELTDP